MNFSECVTHINIKCERERIAGRNSARAHTHTFERSHIHSVLVTIRYVIRMSIRTYYNHKNSSPNAFWPGRSELCCSLLVSTSAGTTCVAT